MKCKVDGCERDATYKGQQVCQKHYFRYMRNGHYGLKERVGREYVKNRKYRLQNPAGYFYLYEPDHPLSTKAGYVYEHRFVYYNQIEKVLNVCRECGDQITWDNAHIDHIDCDVTNNKPNNLRALCRSCNIFRGHSPTSMGRHMLTVDGNTMSANTWARMDGVEVSGATIIRRKTIGMSDYDAIYSPRITHHNTKTKKHPKKYDEERGIKRPEN